MGRQEESGHQQGPDSNFSVTLDFPVAAMRPLLGKISLLFFQKNIFGFMKNISYICVLKIKEL